MNKRVVHSSELGFTIVAEAQGRYVEFVIYEIVGWAESSHGKFDVPRWHKAGSDFYPDFVDKLEESEPYLHGRVKWDGSSNWHFDEQDRRMLYGGSRADLQRIGDVMALCWDMAKDMLPDWYKVEYISARGGHE